MGCWMTIRKKTGRLAYGVFFSPSHKYKNYAESMTLALRDAV